MSASPETEPLVTIAIPTFNRASWLRGCIASALAQTYGRCEILVSDNASTDDTQEVLAACRDPRLRVVRQQFNMGMLPNWNMCLAEARGAYIVFVSDDDRITPCMVERCVDLIKTEPGLPIVITLTRVESPAEGLAFDEAANDRLGTGVRDSADVLLEVLKGRILAPMCTILMRTEEVRERGGFPLDWPHLGDKATWVPLLLNGGRAGFVNERCGHFSTHDGATTSQLAEDVHLSDVRRLVDVILEASDRCIVNAEKCREVKAQAGRYLARCAISLLATRRRQGVTLVDSYIELFKYRTHLARLGPSDIAAMARPLAIILLPELVSRGLRRAMQLFRSDRLP